MTLPFETRSIVQLGRRVAVPAGAIVPMQVEGEPAGGVPVEALFGKYLSVAVSYETAAELHADLAHDADAIALVYSDPDPANSIYWVKSGASGAGEWVKTNIAAGQRGETGPANSTFVTTADLEAAPVGNVSAILAEAGKAGAFTIRDYADFVAEVAVDTGKVNFIRSTSTPTKVWVRTTILPDTGAGAIGFDQGGSFDPATIGGRVLDLPKSLKAAPFYAAAAGDDTDAMMALAVSADTKIALNINSPTRLSNPVDFTDKNLTILGNGAVSSEIRFTDSGGIRFLCTDTTGLPDNAHALELRGLSLIQNEIRTAGNGPTAIEAEWSYPSSATVTRARLAEIEVRGGGPGKFWGKGIRLIDPAQVYMDNIKVYNQEGHQTNLASAAVEIVRDKATNCTGFFLNNIWLGRFVNGFLVSQKDASVGGGTVEGFYLRGGEVVNAAYAIHEDNETLAGYFFDSISIESFHWNVSRAGFKAGRTRGIKATANHFFYQNFGEVVSPAPLEAGFNFLLQLDGDDIFGNTITRYDTITADVPAFLFPDAASLNWASIRDNQIANWLYLADVQPGGAKTELSSKLFIGRNTLIATPLLADYGFRGDKVSIGGNGTAATGTVIDFGHEFNGAPAVNVSYRGPTSGIRAWPDAISATGFTLRHDGVGNQTFSWTAVGI